MTTPTTLRRLLSQNGLDQHESGTRNARSGSDFGDFRVMFDTQTTYSRHGVGYRTRQRSVRTGLIRVELVSNGNFARVSEILSTNNINFTTVGQFTFLINPLV